MPHQPNKHRQKQQVASQSGRGGLFVLVVLLVLISAATIGLAKRQAISDWWALRGYTPPAKVAALAQDDTMTDYTRQVFYVNKPLIADKAAFRNKCPNNDGAEKTIVLGCYHGFQNGIYVLDVTDPRLNGVVQVTAAHETLHAIYDRLKPDERKRVDAMLLNYYNHDLHDERIKNIMDAYRKSEPNDVVNEMHSIFGTEIQTLPSGLETYYKQYFTNRAKIAGYAAAYQSEFTSRQTRVAAADAQLATLKTRITAAEADITSQHQAVETERARLNGLRSDGNTSSYNAGVAPFNSLVNRYNQQVADTKALIEQYNQLVADRNAIALEAGQLASELNASVQPVSP